MTQFDYIIIGAGPAGCVLANRLSADSTRTVLLIEAGQEDTNPLIAMPRGFAELLGDTSTVWHYPTRPFGPAQQSEHWVRGKTLGGSSAVNGMVYNRGDPADYDALVGLGNTGWGWDRMLEAFRQIEDHPLGASATRGENGPLRLSTVGAEDPLPQDVLAAGVEQGWRWQDDLNDFNGERIGPTTATIRDGVRVSAAAAFLHPVSQRSNLTVMVDTEINQLLVEDGAVVEVRGRRDGATVAVKATHEVILAAGALASPKILQLSGIGPAGVLRSAGVEVLVDSPNVGSRLREHRVSTLQFRLVDELGYNAAFSSEQGRREAAIEYQSCGGGPLGRPSFDIVAFFKTETGLDRPDAQLLIAPFSMRPPASGEPIETEREPGMMCVTYPLRPTSEGSVSITSTDPQAPLDIDPGYYRTHHDRRKTAAAFRGVRRLFATEPLAGRVAHETMPGESVQTDQEILDSGLTTGGCGYHAVGTCAMGPRTEDVVDSSLRVRGVRNLRVVDASVYPTMISGNLNGPVTALAWRAADLILEDEGTD